VFWAKKKSARRGTTIFRNKKAQKPALDTGLDLYDGIQEFT
jgi:hypothetical protein